MSNTVMSLCPAGRGPDESWAKWRSRRRCRKPLRSYWLKSARSFFA